MEAQNNQLQAQIAQLDESQLVELIVRTFRGKTQQEVRSSQKRIINSMNQPGVFQKLVKILTASTEPYPNIKKSTALIIKKYSYECAQSTDQYSILLSSIYNLLISDELQFAAKEVLGTAFYNLICVEKHSEYKKPILNDTLQLLSLENSVNKLDGCLIVISSYFNADSNFQSQLMFFKTVFELLASNAMKIIKWVAILSEQQWVIHRKIIMVRIIKFFDVLQDMVEQLTTQQAHGLEESKNMWQHQIFVELLHSYLLLFHNNNSIISTSFTPINQIKKIIMNIILMLYTEGRCPQNIFKSIFFTFLAESHALVNNFQAEDILIKCLAILQNHMERNIYNQIFAGNKLDTIFSILLYSVTNHEQYQLMDQNPQKFVELAEDYTEANIRSDYLKVKAGNFLQIIVLKIDQALRNVLEIVLMISSEVLQRLKSSQALRAQIIQIFNKYAFYRLSDELKIQTCLMVIASLSVQIYKRDDLKQLITGFFMSNFNTIITIGSKLVVLRIVRAVSYFPMGIYFLYIETQMSKDKVFILQGIKSFERILRSNKFPQAMKLLATIFNNLIGVIKINDPIMELMVLNCYETMLKASTSLYKKIRNKIKQEFFINKDTNHHASLICFNFISGLLVKEKDEFIRAEIVDQFYQIVQYLLIPENKQLYFRYEQNIIEIFTQVISLRSFTSPEIQNYAVQTLKYLSRYEKGSAIFKFYNTCILHLQGAVFQLEHYLESFWQQVKLRVQLFFEASEPLQTVAYFCFLMSQIISNNSNISLNQNQLEQLLRITAQVPPQYKQYFLLIFLSFVYEYPFAAVKYLRNKGVYQGFLTEVIQVQFDGFLLKKILILALIRLIEVEQNFNTFKMILNYCLQYLKLQSKKSRKKVYMQSNQIKPRSMTQQIVKITYSSIDEENNDNELINLFVDFKHPYRSLSQFDNFKVILQHRHGFLKQLHPHVLQDIKEILQTQWIDSKTRKIVKVKQ